ncbi:hypothetical protein, partial [Phytoactinopolyspora endophytica]|uniref:hypothetical protein n=1 Tax=Phytoactinopolyspora endophytica TaxID=1642495 RepID=UPI00197C0292
MVATGITMVLAAASVGAGPVIDEPPAPRPGAVAGDPAVTERQTVTLLTGDRVSVRTVDGNRAVDVEPAPGRSSVAFVEQQTESGGL